MAWKAPDVFRYRDYRAFLRAFYALNKSGEYGFSLRAFSKRAQLRSSNYLKLVMVTFDRPFMFLICDEPTGQILFIGNVAEP